MPTPATAKTSGASSDASAQLHRACLRVLSTTDIHANLRAYDYYSDTPDQPFGLSRIASLIRTARAEVPNSLLLDNGDFLQGTPLSDLAVKPGAQWHGDHPVITTMNAIGYDAAGLGNHEFNFGLPWLQDVLEQAAFPFTCGNVLTSSEAEAGPGSTLLPPFLVLPVNMLDEQGSHHMLNVGVLSLVPPQITTWDQFHLAGQIWSGGIVQTARTLEPAMRKAGADIVVVLAHSGIDQGPYDPMMENAVLELTKLPGLDAIVAGHTHKVFPGPDFHDLTDGTPDAGLINGTPVVMAGYRGSHLGVIDLDLHRDAQGWRVLGAQCATRPVSQTMPGSTAHITVPEAEDIVQLLEPAHRATIALTQKPLGQSDRDLHSYLSLIGDCSTVQVVTRAQAAAARILAQELLDHEVPLLSASAPFRAGGHGGPDHYCDIPAGQMYLRHAADLYPFPNMLCIARISGAELRDWLERAATIFNTIRPGARLQPLVNSHVPHHVFDIVDGVTYRIDLTQEPLFTARGDKSSLPGAGRIRALQHNGKDVENTDQFIIATNNYRAFGGGPHRMINPDRVIFAGRQAIVDLVGDYIQSASPQLVPSQDIWQFEPIKDAEIIFPSGPGVLRHPADMAARGVTHLGSCAGGFEQLSLRL